MAPSKVEDSESLARFDDLCNELGVDRVTKNLAWEEFYKMRSKYTLEGDELLWLVCSLYVMSRREVKKVVSKPVAITKLLRTAKTKAKFVFPRNRILSAECPEAEQWKFVLIQFIDKMKKWSEMVIMTDEMLYRVERMEANFTVCIVIFQKMRPLFQSVFLMDSTAKLNESIGRKKRRSPCTGNELFKFCWTIFVYARARFTGISDDLVNSFHLFLCCLDWLYNDAVVGRRTDLLNPEFAPLKEIDLEEEINEAPCTLENLCGYTDGVEMEAKIIKLHYWRPFIQKLIDTKILRSMTLTSGFLDVVNFDSNVRSVNSAYEAHLMNVGDFDERVFLGNPESYPKVVVKLEDGVCVDEVDFGRIPSPVPSEDSTITNSIGKRVTKLHNVGKLQQLLKGRNPEPSERLQSIMDHFALVDSDSTANEYWTKVANFCDLFISNYDNENESDLKRKIDLGKTLFYKLLETIVDTELNRVKNKTVDFRQLMNQENFHKALFACAMEIVIFSFDSDTQFPWILDVYGLKPFDFYKILEAVVKSDEKWSRDVVRHLNWIEEEILDNLAWKENSPLWKILSRDSVPTIEQVIFSNFLEKPEKIQPLPEMNVNPKRRLFTTSLNLPGGNRLLSASSAQNTENEGREKTFTFQTAVGEGGRQVLIPVQLVPVKKDITLRKGSLAIFFRKLYHLASVRLRSLCHKLDIESELRSKIWTLFEHCMVKHVELLKDRHLDQILMCAVYILTRLSEAPLQFQEIISAYRYQPQAQSATYRDILIKREETENLGSESVDSEIRDDLVVFYNQCFVQNVKKFALKFSSKRESDCPLLTPMPLVRGLKVSSRKFGANKRLSISPIKMGDVKIDVAPHPRLRYKIDESLRCDLRFINQMVRSIGKQEKRKRQAQVVQLDQNQNQTQTVLTSLVNPPKVARIQQQTESVAEASAISGLLRQKLMGLVRDRESQEVSMAME